MTLAGVGGAENPLVKTRRKTLLRLHAVEVCAYGAQRAALHKEIMDICG